MFNRWRAALCGLAFVAAAGAPGVAGARSFDAIRDYELTAACFAVFRSLTPTFFAGDNDEMAAMNLRGFRGYMRLRPFSGAATLISANYETRALDYHHAWDLQMTAARTDPERLRIRTEILAVASACEAKMDEWGAPPFTGTPVPNMGGGG